MKNLRSTTNIANKVRNTRLPRTKPLMPLFETISNSIHAIGEAKTKGQLDGRGKIRVELIRNGAPDILSRQDDIDKYPIHSIIIHDDGIGLNEENLQYFVESDTDHKLSIGGKGVGRFICLKAYREINVISNYINKEGALQGITFLFKNTKNGFHDYNEFIDKKAEQGTTITLSTLKPDYQKHSPTNISEIAYEIVQHFQLYFIQEQVPEIVVENQNGTFISLDSVFSKDFKSEVKEMNFKVLEYDLKLILTRSYESKSHKIHYCAHNRSVHSESLYTKIIDLGKNPIYEDDKKYYYHALVVGEVLDNSVGIERIGFDFPNDDQEELFDEITLSKVRKQTIDSVEEVLKDYLSKVREQKIKNYKPLIHDQLPQYRNTLTKRIDQVRKLPPNLTKSKLDLELYKIDQDWRLEVKQKGQTLLSPKKDVTNLEEYKKEYDEFIEDFNEIGKSDLARYVVHRKSIIELLENFLNLNDDSKFEDEDIIHSIFFPIRSTSEEVPYEKQNLWLIDERLTFHSFLASDKKFDKIKDLEVDSGDRSDLIIYNDALVFSEKEKTPFSSFTIVEFKKPQRDDYSDYDPKKNPIEQSEKYIEKILDGKVKDRNGRKIRVDKNIPFYVYIICDITSTLEKILERREYDKTPDGQGYFKMKTKYYNAYFEILPFEKVLDDAKKRNKILFQKLGIDN